jgi:hypothetical protein
MEDRTCTHCGRPLTGRADQRYCSTRCRVASKRERDNPRPKVRRRPLSDDARGVGRDLDRLTQRIERIVADDRLSRESARDSVSFMLYWELQRSAEAITGLLDRLDSPEEIGSRSSDS